MAKLYFRYGAMGSSKTANAIMVQYNYRERGRNALLVKPRLDTRDGSHVVASRSGLSAPCIYIEELGSCDLSLYDCVIVDEAQFLTKAQVEQLVHVVDDMNIPVICYGLRADFLGNLFEGSQWLLAWADTIEEIKTVCWCGKKAIWNARVIDGKVAREGEQIVLGGNESYVALCRKHWAQGRLAPLEIRRIDAGREKYIPLMLLADPSREMIEKYLAKSELYVLSLDGQPIAEAVIGMKDETICELYNLAVVPEQRGQGYAGKLVRYLARVFAMRAELMTVGTSRALVPFYEHLGFIYDHTILSFFKNPARDPNEGEDLEDMEVLTLKLR